MEKHPVKCSFCRLDQDKIAGLLVLGPDDVGICDECAEIVLNIVAEHRFGKTLAQRAYETIGLPDPIQNQAAHQ